MLEVCADYYCVLVNIVVDIECLGGGDSMCLSVESNINETRYDG